MALCVKAVRVILPGGPVTFIARDAYLGGVQELYSERQVTERVYSYITCDICKHTHI